MNIILILQQNTENYIFRCFSVFSIFLIAPCELKYILSNPAYRWLSLQSDKAASKTTEFI